MKPVRNIMECKWNLKVISVNTIMVYMNCGTELYFFYAKNATSYYKYFLGVGYSINIYSIVYF